MIQSKKINSSLRIAIRVALSGGLVFAATSSAFADAFQAGNLIVSTTYYAGDASTVTLGQTLPGGGTAIANGAFPQVFTNETPDASFGVTSPIYLQQITRSGTVVSQTAIDSSQITTSFASKSELALNVSSDGASVSFMGYAAPKNTLDVSNSNTAAVNDPTNPVQSTYARAIANVNLSTGNLQVTNVNAYSGNNGRAAVLANGNFYMVGNAGNSGKSVTATTLNQLSANTGVQMIAQGASGNTTVIGAGPTAHPTTTTGGQYGFDVAQLGKTADKTGKDDNFRGMTIYNGTLYVTKGSGGNGVNTVYQVGATGALNNGGALPSNSAITVLPGLPTTLASAASSASSVHPFGIWFGDSTHLFVADEGDGVRYGQTTTQKFTQQAGLQEWTLGGNGVWSETAVFQKGLLDQSAYTAGMGWNVYTDGLRNITGEKNADGSFSIFATTSTVSDEQTHDLGADPNEIASITIGADSTGADTTFSVLDTAIAGQRYGGVAITPSAVPIPAAAWLFGSGLFGLTSIARKRKTA